ncbi:MAG: ROK family protein [Acidimicrobiia bacterium]|nr:ROK family protein [Acidimicrobiia bacterium]MBP8179589.1 ROK family protein [Acidimicrobiia bacterium]
MLNTSSNPNTVRIGIDVGGTKINAVTLAGREIVARLRVPTPRTSHELIQSVSEVARTLRLDVPVPATVSNRAHADATVAHGVPVGVGIAGMVDRQGRIIHSPNLVWMDGVDVAAELKAATGFDVNVENDANAAVFAEWRIGAGVGVQNLTMVSIGTGIGGGIIADGHLLTGATGFAGEIGHMPVTADGPVCICGGAGHWEAIASGPALGALVDRAFELGQLDRSAATLARPPRPSDLADLARQHRDEVQPIVEDFGSAVARGLEGLIAILDPAVIVLGGGVMDLGQMLLDAVQQSLEQRVEGGPMRVLPELRLAKIGSDAAAVGAALLCDDVATGEEGS